MVNSAEPWAWWAVVLERHSAMDSDDNREENRVARDSDASTLARIS